MSNIHSSFALISAARFPNKAHAQTKRAARAGKGWQDGADGGKSVWLQEGGREAAEEEGEYASRWRGGGALGGRGGCDQKHAQEEASA